MFLVSNFRKVIVLLCVITLWLPSSNSQHVCWNVNLDLLDNDNAFRTTEGCNEPGKQKCGINTRTGYGLKCRSSTDCPSGDYSNKQVVCAYGFDICCCDPIEGQFDACNQMTDDLVAPEACKKPELQNSDMCRPNNICLDSNDKRVTCEKPPGITPYCKMEPGTGQGMGCGTLENYNKDCPKNVEYTANKMVCKDGKCCCKGNDREPCNILTEQSCLLDEFKELEKCKSTNPGPEPGGKPEPSGKPGPGNKKDPGCEEDDKGLCAASMGNWCNKRLVMGMLILTLLYPNLNKK